MKIIENICFIDWQNLNLWIKSDGWNINYSRFRIYLKDKLKVKKAYYFLWVKNESEKWLYSDLEKAWFDLVFKEHSYFQWWKKKWNIDVDLVFEIMHNILKNKDFEKIVLVSWDWDYFKMVKFLIEENLFEKILFPNKKYSSLYKKLKWEFRLTLWSDRVKNVLRYTKKGKVAI